ncbi:EF-hand domain-containing protein [Streptomyces sp. NPDC090106]|uniref:EF-hand domain-containing protein n=1 Tax=Streptomyces sp. NPDC090106 TaxID=3365946 RepID=UPI0037F39D43
MASGFQRIKVQAMFDVFDVDGNGWLEESDFVALAARWGRLPRVDAGSELAARVDSVIMGWWHLLSAAAAERGKTGRIDVEELLHMVDLLPGMRDTVAATADTVFDAVDENGDGRISRGEHQRLIDTWHGREIGVADVFDTLDQDGDGHLSRSEFAELWIQFWISDDPAEPGNLMCGPLSGSRAA